MSVSKLYSSRDLSSQDSYEDFLQYMSDNSASKKQVKKGYGVSDSTVAQWYADYYQTLDEREYDYWLTQDEREYNEQWYYEQSEYEHAYNEYYYNNYESPSAMVKQYQDAGLNPALMYSNGSSGVSSSNNSTSADASANTAHDSSGYSSDGQSYTGDPIENTIGLLGLLGSFAGVAPQIKNAQTNAKQQKTQQQVADTQKSSVESQNKYRDEQTRALSLQNDINEIYGTNAYLLKMDLDRSNIAKNAQEVKESNSRIRKISSDIKVNESTIEVNGQSIELSKAQKELVGAQTMETLARKALENWQLEEMGPLLQEWQRCMINAKEQEAAEIGEKIANLAKWREIGGFEQQLDNMKATERCMYINAGVGGLCNILNSVSNFMPTRLVSSSYNSAGLETQSTSTTGFAPFVQ